MHLDAAEHTSKVQISSEYSHNPSRHFPLTLRLVLMVLFLFTSRSQQYTSEICQGSVLFFIHQQYLFINSNDSNYSSSHQIKFKTTFSLQSRKHKYTIKSALHFWKFISGLEGELSHKRHVWET